jgi:CRISPR-associated protein Csm2
MINNGREQEYTRNNDHSRHEDRETGQSYSSVPKYEPIKTFYIGEGKDKTIRPELFDKVARNIALSFVSVSAGKGEITSTQLRKIYDEVKRFEQLIKTVKNGWNEQKPYIRLIKSKILYQATRAKNKSSKDRDLINAYDNLVAFLNEGIDFTTASKDSPEDFFIFVSLFEAVYGYYYEFKPNKVD